MPEGMSEDFSKFSFVDSDRDSHPRDFGVIKETIHRVQEIVPILKGAVDDSLENRAGELIEKMGIEDYLKKDGQYLDVGTGKGHIIQRILADMEKSGNPLRGYYGIDVGDKPLEQVQKRELARQGDSVANKDNPMNFAWATAEELPFGDEMLDGVSFDFSLHDLNQKHMSEALSEAKRVIKPDGRIFVTEDITDSAEEMATARSRDKMLNLKIDNDKSNFKSEQEWDDYFDQMGLEIVAKRPFTEDKNPKVKHAFYVLKLKTEKDISE